MVAESAANSQPASPEQHTEALQQPASSAEPPQQASAPLVPAYATSQLGAPTAQLGMQIGAGISALQHTSPDAATATATATTEPATPHAATPPATAAAAMAVSQAELSAAPAAPGAEMTEQASAVVVLAATEPLQPASHLAQAESVSLMTAEESGHLATQPEVPTGSVTHAQAQVWAFWSPTNKTDAADSATWHLFILQWSACMSCLPDHQPPEAAGLTFMCAQYEAKLTEVWAASAARQAKAEGILRKREQQLAAMRPVVRTSPCCLSLSQRVTVQCTLALQPNRGSFAGRFTPLFVQSATEGWHVQAPESGVDFQLRQPALVAATPNVMQRKVSPRSRLHH